MLSSEVETHQSLAVREFEGFLKDQLITCRPRGISSRGFIRLSHTIL